MTTVRRTNRWRGVVAVALFAGVVGITAKRPLVLLAGAVGVCYAVYPRLSGPPSVDLAIDRSLAPGNPNPGDEVAVTVTLTNEGDRTLWDLRVVDGVPGMLSVVDGSARHAAALRPGASSQFTYAVEATQGTHVFDPATVVARDLSGGSEMETTVAADTELSCRASVPHVPLRRKTGQHAGPVTTDRGGAGVEFHSTRDYRRGDPLSRVDWKRLARTDELTTVDFREERTASVVVCVDARLPAYRGRGEEPHAVALAVGAAESLLGALVARRTRVGVAGVGREFCWLPPGGGDQHAARAGRLLATHPTLSTTPPAPGDADPDAEEQLRELRAQLRPDTQVFLLSPLADAFAERAALTLHAAGHAVTVLSPDVTSRTTAGERLAAVERDNLVHSLRNAGVRVVDWSPDEPLGTVLLRAGEARPA